MILMISTVAEVEDVRTGVDFNSAEDDEDYYYPMDSGEEEEEEERGMRRGYNN
jgi:hypothetical protein